jgi:hypothetical protein
MKTKLANNRSVRATVYFLSLSILLFIHSSSLQAQSTASTNSSIVVQKKLSSKKYKIKLFPSASQEVLFFNAVGDAGKVYQFYLFDLEGKLVKQTQIRNRETTMLTNFLKGDYTFEIFSDDERIENGIVAIR